MASVGAHRFAQRLAELRARVDALAAGRDITIVAVTKSFDESHVREAIAAGAVDVGESYAQEVVEKWRRLTEDEQRRARLHFIGRLQTNKVRLVAPFVALWQSIDRPELAERVARHAPDASVLVQVNISGEPQKGGCAPTDVAALIERCSVLGLDVRGLMGVGPAGSRDATRSAFQSLRSLVDRFGLPICSMGMTDDLDIALAEGSTMVRVGSALFGPRPEKPDLRH